MTPVMPLGVTSSREGFGPGSRFVLTLPDAPLAPENPIGAPPRTTAPMDSLGANGENGGPQ